MITSTSSPAEYVRRGLLKIDDATVLAAVDSLNLRGNGKISAVVGMPLRSLQQRRDVTIFAVSAPIAAAKALLEILAMTPLDEVVQELGEHADSPSYEQLSDAVDHLLANGSTNDDVVALLTFAIGEEFPAAPHCRRLLDERLELQLPPLPEVESASSLLAPKEVDPEVRELRRVRRDEKREKKKENPAQGQRLRPAKVKRGEAKAKTSPQIVVTSNEPVTVTERRRVLLTPGELEEFNTEHPMAGAVILAEILFNAVDPEAPEQRGKARPALVVAASDVRILVRGIYSNPGVTRVLFSPWRRLGFDHVSYIDGETVALNSGGHGELVRLGRLTDVEWNSLL